MHSRQVKNLITQEFSNREYFKTEIFKTRQDKTPFLVLSWPRNQDKKFLDPSLSQIGLFKIPLIRFENLRFN